MVYSDFLPKEYTQVPSRTVVSAEAPSNIALIKYWGKHGLQLPMNPSISFTLDKCKTITKLFYEKLESPVADDEFDFEVIFDGKDKPKFKPKIEQFFSRIVTYMPFIKDYKFIIDTKNSFPHSSGIASSASGMGALSLCLMQLEKQLCTEMSVNYFEKKLSFIARMGSGSASRSFQGPLVVWGAHQAIQGSSDLIGVKYPLAIHSIFEGFQDTILLIDRGEKQVSSTVGHNLMNTHPYATGRYEQAFDQMHKILPILASGDIEAFINLVESEALTLHAMMMTANPYFILMKPNTLEVISRIWNFRRDTQLPICFTLDAGANVHVLYPKQFAESILKFIKSDLAVFCQQGQYICDNVGFGAKII